MPKHKGVIVAGLVLVIAALGAPSALSKAGGTDKSLHGTISGTASGTIDGTFIGGGSGNLAHLGKVTMTFGGTLVTTAQFEAALDGTIVFVSANGDELTGTFSGFASTLTGQINIGGPIAGGTGRFEDATGFFDVRGSQDTATPGDGSFTAIFEFPFTGAITY
jgi:hypothetical protein